MTGRVPSEPGSRPSSRWFRRAGQAFLAWRRARRHVHEFHDWYVFDSSASVSIADPRNFRVVGQQIMTLCRCGRTDRKPLRTWDDARAARRRLPYIPWGIMVHRAPLPEALRDRDRSAEGGETGTGSTEGKSPGRQASPKSSRNSPPNHPTQRREK